MSIQNGQHEVPEVNQELLDQLEDALAQVHAKSDNPLSFSAFCAYLAQSELRPNATFQQQLESQLIVKHQQQKEASIMHTAKAKHEATPQRRSKWSGLRFSRFTLRTISLGATAIVFMVGLVAATPPVRANVEQFLERFGLVLVDPAMLTSAPSPSGEEAAIQEGPAPVVQPYVPQKLERTEAQQQTPFPIRLPTWVPEGLGLEGLEVEQGAYGCSSMNEEECAKVKPPVMIRAFYRSQSIGDANLILEITEITPEGGGGYGVLSSAAESVEVNKHPALYVAGIWEKQQADDDLVWNSTLDHSTLSWQEDKQIYVLSSNNLGLSREDMIRIAESLR